MLDLQSITGLLIILIPLIGVQIVNIIAALRVNIKINQINDKVDAADIEVARHRVDELNNTKNLTNKIDAVAVQSEVIKTHVNSAADAAQAREDSLRKEMSMLRDIIANKDRDAALLAQAVAQQSGGIGDRKTDINGGKK
jgi:hypothetical protein